jgi:hypothetical protein
MTVFLKSVKKKYFFARVLPYHKALRKKQSHKDTVFLAIVQRRVNKKFLIDVRL